MRLDANLIARRTLLAAALAAPAVEFPQAAHGVIKGLEDKSVQQYDRAPLTGLPRDCLNVAGKKQASLEDFLSKGLYVVLWVFPEAGLGLERSNNELEARNFQKMQKEYADLDAVALGITSLPAKNVQELIGRERLTIPFLIDPSRELIRAYTDADDRVTFIISPDGQVRWAERNIQYNVGNFNLENHAVRVGRELYPIRNTDGWSV